VNYGRSLLRIHVTDLIWF